MAGILSVLSKYVAEDSARALAEKFSKGTPLKSIFEEAGASLAGSEKKGLLTDLQLFARGTEKAAEKGAPVKEAALPIPKKAKKGAEIDEDKVAKYRARLKAEGSEPFVRNTIEVEDQAALPSVKSREMGAKQKRAVVGRSGADKASDNLVDLRDDIGIKESPRSMNAPAVAKEQPALPMPEAKASPKQDIPEFRLERPWMPPEQRGATIPTPPTPPAKAPIKQDIPEFKLERPWMPPEQRGANVPAMRGSRSGAFAEGEATKVSTIEPDVFEAEEVTRVSPKVSDAEYLPNSGLGLLDDGSTKIRRPAQKMPPSGDTAISQPWRPVQEEGPVGSSEFAGNERTERLQFDYPDGVADPYSATQARSNDPTQQMQFDFPDGVKTAHGPDMTPKKPAGQSADTRFTEQSRADTRATEQSRGALSGDETFADELSGDEMFPAKTGGQTSAALPISASEPRPGAAAQTVAEEVPAKSNKLRNFALGAGAAGAAGGAYLLWPGMSPEEKKEAISQTPAMKEAASSAVQGSATEGGTDGAGRTSAESVANAKAPGMGAEMKQAEAAVPPTTQPQEAAATIGESSQKVEKGIAEVEQKLPGMSNVISDALNSSLSQLKELQKSLLEQQAQAGAAYKSEKKDAMIAQALGEFAQALVKYAAATEGVNKRLNVAQYYQATPVDFKPIFDAIDNDFKSKMEGIKQQVDITAKAVEKTEDRIFRGQEREEDRQAKLTEMGAAHKYKAEELQQGHEFDMARDKAKQIADNQSAIDQLNAKGKLTKEELALKDKYEKENIALEGAIKKSVASIRASGDAQGAKMLMAMIPAVYGAAGREAGAIQEQGKEVSAGIRDALKLKTPEERKQALSGMAKSLGVEPSMKPGALWGENFDEAGTIAAIQKAAKAQQAAAPRPYQEKAEDLWNTAKGEGTPATKPAALSTTPVISSIPGIDPEQLASVPVGKRFRVPETGKRYEKVQGGVKEIQ